MARPSAMVLRWLVAVMAACLAVACLQKPYPRGRTVVETVELEGAESISQARLLEGLATAGSPRFLSVWDGVVFDYELFDEAVLARDLERVVRFYRARGYYEAQVTAARVVRTDPEHVRVYVRIVEGPQVTVAALGVSLCELPSESAPPRCGDYRAVDEACREPTRRGPDAQPVCACRTSCSSDLDCRTGAWCDAGRCTLEGAECVDDSTVRLPPHDSTSGTPGLDTVGQAVACWPYQCRGRTCADSCEAASDCAPGYQCSGGRCEACRALPPANYASIYAESVLALTEGEPFDEDDYEAAKRALSDAFADAGYASVKVRGEADVDLAARTATVRFVVSPGPVAEFGEVEVSVVPDDASIPRDRLLTLIDVAPGEPFSRKRVRRAEAALLGLGIFSAVQAEQSVLPPAAPGGRPRVALRFRATPSTLRTVKLGGGTRLDQLRFSNTIIAGWEDRNFLGGLRRFSVDARLGITWFPTRLPGGAADDDGVQAPDQVLFEPTVRLALRQPALIGPRTAGFVSADYSRYALLYAGHGVDEPILGYNEVGGRTGIEHTLAGGSFYLTPAYNLQANFPFMYSDDPQPAGLERVVVSFPEVLAVWDGRDDRVRTRQGFYLSAAVDTAGRTFGSDLSDLRLRPEARAYVTNARLTLAVRGTLGLLFPFDYGETLQRTPTAEEATSPDFIRDQQKLLFRAYYSGGPNSNRGYPFRGVGPHGPLGFLVAGSVRCELGDPNPPQQCERPLGGLTLWEASLELRWQLLDPLDVVFFVDSSDVTREVSELNRAAPHVSPGLGARYITPVGPLRVDLGFRVPGWQVVGLRDETSDQPGVPTVFPAYGNAGTLFGLPAALHVLIGEAF